MPKILILLFMFLLSSKANCIEEIYSSLITKSDIALGTPLEVEDGKFTELGNGNFTDLHSILRVKLSVNEDPTYGGIPTFTNFSIEIDVLPYNNSSVPQTAISTKTLTISYNELLGGLELNYASIFENSDIDFHKYKITYTILNGASVPDNVYLEAELIIDRYYEISAKTPIIGSNYIFYDANGLTVKGVNVNKQLIPENITNNGQELEIWWDYIEGAQSYELEWTWIDNYGPDLATNVAKENKLLSEIDFENNNTRILTNEQSYNIPLIYARGFIVYRVRGVGRWLGDYTDKNIKKAGKWSSYSANSSRIKVGEWPHYVILGSTHDALKNWQYQAVYAEDGKKKEIVNYFDASLRNRQTVTKINSNNEAIVGENIYDNQGRSAVQILPTPVGNPALRYYPALNQNDVNGTGNASDIFTHKDFDWDEADPDICLPDAKPMSTFSGASKYYSNNNIITASNVDDWQNQVPQAGGFPYVQIEYTPDNTGRISKQGGVGAKFTIDGTHATQYFYGQPYQEELNRLFGFEVGHKSRYKKNMVVDANGQVSISYLDPQGRVIATALSGHASGTGLEALYEEDNGEHEIVIVDLLAKINSNDVDQETDDNIPFSSGEIGANIDGLRFNTQILNGLDGDPHNFKYTVETSEFTDNCVSGVSFPYAYVLDIGITDVCGIGKILDYDKTFNIGQNTIKIYSGIENESIGGNQDLSYSFSSSLDIGSFTTGKDLKIDSDILNQYTDQFINDPNNTCVNSLESFDDLSPVDCIDDVLPLDMQIEVSNCFVIEQMLLSDVSPNGQYGSSDPTDLLSVFSNTSAVNKGHLSSSPYWKNPNFSYEDDQGNTSHVIVTYNFLTQTFDPQIDLPFGSQNLIPITNSPGQYKVEPEYLTDVNDFIANWKSSWAKSLVEYHPEHCYLSLYDKFCNLTSSSCGIFSSDNYDNNLLIISTYEDANDATKNNLGTSLIPTSSGESIKDNDPFFCLPYATGSNSTDIFYVKGLLMDEILLDYKHIKAPYTGITLWEFAVKTVTCGSNFSGNCTLCNVNDIYNMCSYSTTIKDQIWSTYKQLYLAEKNKIKQMVINFETIASDCYNGYIEKDGQSIGLIQSYTDYPEVLESSPALSSNLNTQTYSSSYGGLMDFYKDAVDFANGATSNQTPWFGDLGDPNNYRHLFRDKIKRFIPIDNLYDSSLPDILAMNSGSLKADKAILEQTGRCPLGIDLEYFLSALAQNSQLETTTNSNSVPEFTYDLFTNMGGTIATNGLAVNIIGSVSGNTLTISVTDAGGATPLQKTISLNLPNNPTPSWSWSDIQSFKTLYYLSGSQSGGVFAFKIIATVLDGGTIKEVVLDGSTKIEVGDCVIEEICESTIELGTNLGLIFKSIFDAGQLNSTYTNNIANVANSWYSGSELQNQLNDLALNSDVKNYGSLGYFTVENLNSNIWFTVSFTNYPAQSTISHITGYQFSKNPSSGNYELEIYYIDNTGSSESLKGDVTYYNDNGNPLELLCPCEEGISYFEDLYETMINSLLDAIWNNYNHGDGELFITDYNLQDLSPLEDYISHGEELKIKYARNHIDYIAGPNPAYTGEGLFYDIIGADGQPCRVMFNYSNPTPSNPSFEKLSSISDVTITTSNHGEITHISAIGHFPGNIQLAIETVQIGACMHITVPCDPCIPETVEPKSCTKKFTEYNTIISNYNSIILANQSANSQFFPVYTLDEFCDENLAYATDGYLHYISGLVMDIDNPKDPYYISIGRFVNTGLNSGYNNIISVIDAFKIYTDDQNITPSNTNWNNYINDIYLPNASPEICPPAPMPAKLNFEMIDYPCEPLKANSNVVNAANQYDIQINNLRENFKQKYIEGAMKSVIEKFTLSKTDKEYHYTLYYYDQAGNLVQTVPPNGVDRLETPNIDHSKINSDRSTDNISSNINNLLPDVIPIHNFRTQYKYNSLNQLVWQTTPDGGVSNFAYDDLGRLVISQNSKQLANNELAYTLYGPLGRILEVGQFVLETTGNTFEFENGQFKKNGTVQDLSGNNFPSSLMKVGTNFQEVTKTFYDDLDDFALISITDKFKEYTFDNTRNRITAVTYYDSYASIDPPTDYNSATFYDYDVHGNVKELIQDIADPDLVNLNQNQKSTEYKYDLVSGNVKEVTYQEDQSDQFLHKYSYDADNRITIVETTKDKINWEKDAKYFYYNHGPLARVEIGDQKVQSLDYAYTIQGWLKGINSENLSIPYDQARDGVLGGVNRMNGKDVVGISLHYFDEDYANRLGTNYWQALTNLNQTSQPISDLYNGNIKEMYTASTDVNEEYLGSSNTWYEYDQLNRIKSMAQEEVNTIISIPNLPKYDGINGYSATYDFDANGNLINLTRTIPNTGLIDDFTYNYSPGSNQLDYVIDGVPDSKLADYDLDSQPILSDADYNEPDTNYAYDEIGQLIQDKQAEINRIDWTVTGKVKSIIRKTGSTENDIEFNYDPMGNRINKTILNNTRVALTKTFYFRDAQGNSMATYTLNLDEDDGNGNSNNNLYLSERNIYGSSRLGIETVDQVIASSNTNLININNENDLTNNISVQQIGDKRYELSNHLGNVLQVISDRKLAIDYTAYNHNTGTYTSTSPDGSLDFYSPDVISQTDYYPFGMVMPNRNEPGDGYRYGFQGQEMDDEIKGEGNSVNYKYRMHDPRIGRFFAVDPLASDYPHNGPYNFSENRVIDGVELEGLEYSPVNFKAYFQGMFDSFLKATGADQIFEKSGNNSYNIEASKETKAIMKDGLIIVGGVVTTIASGGTATGPYMLAFGVTSGVFATVAGASKLALDLKGDVTKSSEIPTTPLGAFGKARDKLVGDENGTGEAIGDFANGIILLLGVSWSEWGTVSNADKVLTVKGAIDATIKAGNVVLSEEVKSDLYKSVIDDVNKKFDETKVVKDTKKAVKGTKKENSRAAGCTPSVN